MKVPRVQITPEGMEFLKTKLLTKRQIETLMAILNSESVKSAAEYIFLSVKGLKYTKTILHRKIGVKNNHSLIIAMIPYLKIVEKQEIEETKITSNNLILPVGNKTQ